MSRCPICSETNFWGAHKCPPLWFVLIGDEATEYNLDEDLPPSFAVYADNASDAAKKRVLKWDDGELATKGDEIGVVVYDVNMANPLRFDVQGYMQPIYSACEHIERKVAP